MLGLRVNIGAGLDELLHACSPCLGHVVTCTVEQLLACKAGAGQCMRSGCLQSTQTPGMLAVLQLRLWSQPYVGSCGVDIFGARCHCKKPVSAKWAVHGAPLVGQYCQHSTGLGCPASPKGLRRCCAAGHACGSDVRQQHRASLLCTGQVHGTLRKYRLVMPSRRGCPFALEGTSPAASAVNAGSWMVK